MYSPVERPSIDPVILIKLTLIQYTFGICFMQKTIEEVKQFAYSFHAWSGPKTA